MKLTHYNNVTLEDVNIEGAKDAKIRWLVSDKDGAPNFAMRMFEIQPEGHTPYHKHEWEHEMYVLEGNGIVKTEEGEKPFTVGDVMYIDPQKLHNFSNSGDTVLRFLCIIPNLNKPVKKKNANPFASGKANNC